jgi:DNA end-binding protein Ku
MRSMWSGSISFSLVNIPVKLYSATAGEKVSFDQLHAKDLSPIRYARVCRRDGEEVPYNQIVKGFEYAKDSYVVMEDEDFEKANARKTSAIEITNFVKETEIDSIYFEKPYYLAPGGGADKSYTLFREALKKAQKVAVAKYVLRSQEKLAVLKPEGDIIVLNQMRFHDDLRDYHELEVPEVKVDKQEIDLALTLIDRLSRPFDAEAYHDTYRNELLAIIQDKVEGKVPAKKGEAPHPTEVKDLMSALRDSLRQAQP